MRPSQPTTESDAVDIWSWKLDASPSDLSIYSTLLSSDETARAGRFVHDHHRRDFIVARGRLRQILAGYTGIHADELLFEYNRFGKPRISRNLDLTLHFNLSHSANLAVLGVSPAYELGVDVEEKKVLKEDIAAHFFSAKEQATLKQVTPDCYLDHFYRCWTRKEAFVKAHGAGLSLALDAFDVTFTEDATPKLERLAGEPDASAIWTLLNLQTPPNFAGAVAAQTFGDTVHLRYCELN